LEEEGRLNDLPLRENFIERVFAYYRWMETLKNNPIPDPEVAWMSAVVPWLIATPLMGVGV
jgi:hypothetical protein